MLTGITRTGPALGRLRDTLIERDWLGMMDSNHRYLIQSQAAYR